MTTVPDRVRALGAERRTARERLADVTARLADAVADAHRQGYAVTDVLQWAGIARRTYYAMTEGVTRDEDPVT